MGNLLRSPPPRPADEQRVLRVLVYHPATNARLYRMYLARVAPWSAIDLATVQRKTSTVHLHWCSDVSRIKAALAAHQEVAGLMLIVDAARTDAAREAYDECASMIGGRSLARHVIEQSGALTLDDMVGAFHDLFSAMEKATTL